ncbi:MAG: SUMF1/EgtB/PvdO family nonheme iron enzyme [Deltaproteobacteria bacterium]|nr:SUMF1/EgtB/PvdO family nonheme iron enzyme [Deltaproteobacteria bacterium]
MYGQLKKKHQDDLNRLGDLFGPPSEIAHFYIQPNCQQLNPADKDEDQAVSYVRSPVLETISSFLSGEIAAQQGDRHMFVLSDAGMGKTSLLIMLKLTHMSEFWPGSVRCALLKIGEDTLAEIEQIEGKQQTVLLLDSLDEDPTAWADVKTRLISLLDATRHFRRVIITCRTQFFPTTETDVFERPGYVKVGGYACPSIYLSLFSDKQIDEYLHKRFPKTIWHALSLKSHPKYEKSKRAVEKMRSLKCRPMLLSHIESILEGNRECETEYDMYDMLIQQWLDREEIKSRRRKDRITANELKTSSVVIAAALQRTGRRVLSREALLRLCDETPVIKKLEFLDISGRSLLNRTSEGNFRFAHYTIQEFLVARALAEGEISDDMHKLHITPFMGLIYAQRLTRHTGYELLWIPGGEFQMGSKESNDESPVHNVHIKGFCLGKYPVTNEQYKRFMTANPGVHEPDFWGHRKFNHPQQPVVGISFEDARQYCEWAGMRLPSEAEWEYACRAGSTTQYCNGDSESDLERAGWFAQNSGKSTHSVGEKEPNRFGLYDMHGNVWEWIEDDWHDNYNGAPVDGRARVNESRADFRVYRGGSWNYDARYCRSAYRGGRRPDFRYVFLGFRPARSIP